MAHGEDVEVKFGASLTGLTAGVNKVKEEIESLRAPVEHFVESLKGVVGGRASDFWNLARTCARLGTHYTPRAYVERLALPTIVEALRADWEAVKARSNWRMPTTRQVRLRNYAAFTEPSAGSLSSLGDGYAEALWDAYRQMPRSADYVMYWWHRAAQDRSGARVRLDAKEPVRID
jgi:hypothetical protein